ncbi:MAG: hypothetical protein ACYC66_04860 [Chloroflexota bacterium]
MEGKEPRDPSIWPGKISRRQILRCVPALAAGAFLKSAAVSAHPAADPTSPPGLAPLQTQLPDTREGALRSERELIEACVARGNSLSSDMPMRLPAEAVESCRARRQSAEKRAAPQLSPLQQLLAATPLAESRLGLSHWTILEEEEDLNLGHFRFPVSPYTAFAEDGRQRFLLLGNFPLLGEFRGWDYLENVQRRIFDRGLWAMANGCQGTAVVEFDRPTSPEKVSGLIRILYEYGVRTITWGNELNDPHTPWRDNLPELVKIFRVAADTKRQYQMDDLDLSLPGLAYYGNGEYLQKLLKTFGALLPRRLPGEPIKQLPFQRVVDHYYGPVEGFLQRLTLMRETMDREGMNGLKFDLAEVGNPTMNGGQEQATDEQLAEGYVPQITSLAIASGMMDRLYYYSLLDRDDGYSLVRIDKGNLARKPSYHSFITMARLLSRLSKITWSETGETMRVEGSRTDGIEFTLVWSRVTGRELVVPVPSDKRIFDALGQEVKEAAPQQVALPPRSHPSLAGPARILVSGVTKSSP